MNNLEITSFLNDSELIYLHTVKCFQVLLSNANNSIHTQLNGFKYCYPILIILFNINLFLPIDETLTCTTTLGQSGPGSNSNEEVLHIAQNSRT